MKRSSISLIVAALVVFLLMPAMIVIPGCTSPSTDTTGAESTNTSAAVQEEPTRVVVVQGVDPTGMDPAQQRETSTANVLWHLYDPLLERDTEDPTKFNGILATSWEQIDSTTVEFKLKEGVSFTGGEPFDAETVKYNVDRLLGKLPGSEPAILSYQFGTVVGAEVVDQYTVRITTKAPDAMFLGRMAQLGMIPTGAVDADPEALMSEPNGTGPYTLVTWDRNNEVVLRAKADYHRGEAQIDEVVFRTLPEATTRLAEIQAGNVDVITNVPPENIADVSSAGNATTKEVPSARVAAVWLNALDDPILAKKEVRQALNYAIDIDTITKNVMNGYGVPVATIVPEYFVGYRDDMKPYPYDEQKARDMLTAAGVPKDYTVEIMVPRGRYLLAEEVTQAVAAYLQKVGVNVKINAVEFGVFAEATQAREVPGMFYAAWGNPQFDPLDMLETTVKSGTNGFSFYVNPTVDALIEEASSTIGDEHIEALRKVEEAIYEDPPFIFLFAQKDLYGVSDRLNWEPQMNETINMYDASVSN